MTPEQLLREAAAVIRTRGLCKGTFGDEGGRHCALGALLAVDSENVTGDCYAVARGALVKQIGEPSISSWNDDPARTAGEVIAAFEAAADSLAKAVETSDAALGTKP